MTFEAFDLRFSRRIALRAASAASIAIAGGGALTQRSPSAGAAEGDIVIGWPGITYRTEPDRASIGMYPLNTNIFESLVRLTPDFQVEPLLAESWELIEPNTWRFVLRQGVVFHDGTPFSAEAVKWSMDRIARAGGGSSGITEESTVIVDDFTVEITPGRANRRFVEQLVHPSQGSIVAPGSEPALERIGTGPFREVEYVVDDRYVVEANPTYWGEAPGVTKITFRFLPDPTTRVLALQAGEVDMISELPRESVLDVEGNGDLQVITSGVGAYSAFYINIHGENPYELGQEIAVREAIARAIDKDAIVQGVWQGNAEPGVSLVPPAILGDEVRVLGGTGYDPDAARAVLDAAGWIVNGDGARERDGRRLSLEMINGYPSAASHGQMPEFLQAQLAEIGIEVRLVQMADTAMYEERLQAGSGDLWVEAGSQNDANPCFLPSLLFATPDAAGDPEANMYGSTFAPGGEFDTFIAQCSTGTTTQAVQSAAANAMKVLVDDQFVVVPIAGTYRIYGAKQRIAGFAAHPSGVNQRWTSLTVTS